jgi:large subunit ribosomal protein L32
MPQEPKKRHSRQRQGKRRAAIKITVSKTVICPNCNAPILAHQICRACGYYKGKMVIKKKSKEEKKESKQTEEK